MVCQQVPGTPWNRWSVSDDLRHRAECPRYTVRRRHRLSGRSRDLDPTHAFLLAHAVVVETQPRLRRGRGSMASGQLQIVRHSGPPGRNYRLGVRSDNDSWSTQYSRPRRNQVPAGWSGGGLVGCLRSVSNPRGPRSGGSRKLPGPNADISPIPGYVNPSWTSWNRVVSPLPRGERPADHRQRLISAGAEP